MTIQETWETIKKAQTPDNNGALVPKEMGYEDYSSQLDKSKIVYVYSGNSYDVFNTKDVKYIRVYENGMVEVTLKNGEVALYGFTQIEFSN